MATKPEQRGNVFRVRWRLGGSRGAPFETARFVIPEGGGTAAAYKLALAAKDLAEAMGHRITGREVEDRILGMRDQPRSVPTLKDFFAEWVEGRRPINPESPGMDDIQPDTLDDYVRIAKVRILPRLGHLYVSDIDEDALKDWIKWLKGQKVRKSKANPKGVPISADSVRRAHSLLHQVLAAAVPQWLPRNPAARPHGSRKSPLGLPKPGTFEGIYLEPWERDLIQSHCDDRIADLWFVMVRTGLRLGEILVLRPQDVTLTGDNPVIRVRRALKPKGKIGLPKSAKSRRDVAISTAVVKVLERRCKGVRPRDLLWPSPRAKSLSEGTWSENNLYRRHWLPAVAEAMRCPKHPPPAPPKPKSGPTRKLRFDEVSDCACPGVLRRRPRLHDGRHTHASELIRGGWQPIEVQHRLGHASYSTTVNIYFHLWQNRDDKDRLDKIERRRGTRRLTVARQHELMVDDEAA
jgi:integrase